MVKEKSLDIYRSQEISLFFFFILHILLSNERTILFQIFVFSNYFSPSIVLVWYLQ